eukprot:365811-Chlamydomonas_euryale.AAC.10
MNTVTAQPLMEELLAMSSEEWREAAAARPVALTSAFHFWLLDDQRMDRLAPRKEAKSKLIAELVAFKEWQGLVGKICKLEWSEFDTGEGQTTDCVDMTMCSTAMWQLTELGANLLCTGVASQPGSPSSHGKLTGVRKLQGVFMRQPGCIGSPHLLSAVACLPSHKDVDTTRPAL